MCVFLGCRNGRRSCEEFPGLLCAVTTGPDGGLIFLFSPFLSFFLQSKGWLNWMHGRKHVWSYCGFYSDEQCMGWNKTRHILNLFSLSGGFSGGGSVCSRCVCGGSVGRCWGSSVYSGVSSGSEVCSLSTRAASLCVSITAACHHDLLSASETAQPVRQQGKNTQLCVYVGHIIFCHPQLYVYIKLFAIWVFQLLKFPWNQNGQLFFYVPL